MTDQPDDNIRQRAYALWKDAGSPEGDDEKFWLDAETELMARGALDRPTPDAEAPTPMPYDAADIDNSST